MQFSEVRAQLDVIFSRAIETGVSVKQNYPSVNTGTHTIGDLNATTIALKNIPYSSIYAELERNNQYHIKLPDGGLLIFQYAFDDQQELVKHRLGYFPSPILPTVEEAPELYEQDQLYGDILLNRIVRFPIRFDFDPSNYKPGFHPHSHLTFGQFDNCRIPASRAISPNIFLIFILRNFYFFLYRRHKNKFDKRMSKCMGKEWITENEMSIPYFTV